MCCTPSQHVNTYAGRHAVRSWGAVAT